ncbi:hypothetical protein FITA111629_07640 [Filibacter tadaridae]|uniref:Yip1 domain protein n=2 Tax=Filibacter tadaridae TaxID=2483811 RepID=A0A3P5X242_9BACL|nr:hypothetical protein FILTAD_01801 [Filibacter tadaridae]
MFYFMGVIAWTYGFHWMLILWTYSVRFTAADGPPGDIGIGSKLVYSVGFPLFNFVLITVIFLLYRFILNNFDIELKKVVPIIFNVIITAYLIWRVVYVVFDYHL